MSIKILTEEQYLLTNWSGGTTCQVYIYPEDSNLDERDFIFRISSAEIEAEESKFTNFSGYNRYLLSTNNSLHLLREGKEIELKPYEIFYFDGEEEIHSFSPAKDFNLILKKGYQGSMRCESLKVEEFYFKNEDKISFIYTSEKPFLMVEGTDKTKIEKEEGVLLSGQEEIYIKALEDDSQIIIVEVEID